MPGKPEQGEEGFFGLRTARLLLLAAVLNAVFFVGFHPLDWQQPETIRLRFYGLQDGLTEGPVTSRIRAVDFLKPFANRAQGGEYESRYPSVLLDGLLAKLYQPLYRVFGPFLKEPVNILILALTGITIFFAIRAFFASVSAACLGTAFWLSSSQVLLDLCYPVRLNMVLAALMTVFILWRLAVLPRFSPSWRPLPGMVLAFLLGFHSHESIICMLPLCILIVISRRQNYRGWGLKLAAGVVVALGIVFFNMFLLVPKLIETATGAPPPWTFMDESLAGTLLAPGAFGRRIHDYGLVGLLQLLRQEGGMSALIPPPLQVLGVAATAGLLILAGRRGWKASWPYFLGTFLFFGITALFLFPTVPASVETEAYYYAPIVAVLAVAAGGLSTGFSRVARPFFMLCPAIFLAVLGTLNTLNADRVMKAFPYWFGFRGPAREYVRDILEMDNIFEENGVRKPVYLAYPRPRRFDISTKWDIMLRIWNVDPPRIFSMMVPNLHLGFFERGDYLGDPRGFSAFFGVPEGEYETAARSLADLPRRGWYDLEQIRETTLPSETPVEWVNPDTGEKTEGRPEPGLLGMVPRARLGPGRWRLDVVPPDAVSPETACLVAVRADLQAPGGEEVYYRETPLPEKPFRLLAIAGGHEIPLGHDYGWSFQLHQVPLQLERETRLEVESGGACEVLGPVYLTVPDITFRPWLDPAGGR